MGSWTEMVPKVCFFYFADVLWITKLLSVPAKRIYISSVYHRIITMMLRRALMVQSQLLSWTNRQIRNVDTQRHVNQPVYRNVLLLKFTCVLHSHLWLSKVKLVLEQNLICLNIYWNSIIPKPIPIGAVKIFLVSFVKCRSQFLAAQGVSHVDMQTFIFFTFGSIQVQAEYGLELPT